MLELALYVAMGCAAVSALAGSRTAWVMLASVAFALGLDFAGAAFNFVMWMMFDIVVVILIVRATMTYADCVLIALFIPAWLFYVMPEHQRYLGSMLVTICQLLLTAPLDRVTALPKRVREWFGPSDIYDKMVAHVRLVGG